MSMYETPQPSEKHIVCVWCVCVRACVCMCMCVYVHVCVGAGGNTAKGV